MNELIDNEKPYWYTCPECGEVFDLWNQEIKRGNKIFCPACFIPIARVHIYKNDFSRFEDIV